uniref:Uncharacterized protein n=1 Tax=Anguilla anguilla TaxID=7936 RepID=A0A0E9Q515_ANGAN
MCQKIVIYNIYEFFPTFSLSCHQFPINSRVFEVTHNNSLIFLTSLFYFSKEH